MSKEKNVNISNVIQHLDAKWGNKPCPICDSNSWYVSDKVYELREFHNGNLIVAGVPIFPVIPVTCNNCGNTVMVSALKAGAIEKSNVESFKEVENDQI